MSKDAFKVKNSLELKPVDLSTIINPVEGQLATDINDDNMLKRYDVANAGWFPVGYASVPITQEEVVDLTGSGSFTGGTFRVARSGNLITFSALTDFTHASATSSTSAAGAVPVWARPVDTQQNSYRTFAAGAFNITVNPAGAVSTSYFDWSGSPINQTNISRPNISYTVESQETVSGLASQSNLTYGRVGINAAQVFNTSGSVVQYSNVPSNYKVVGSGVTWNNGTYRWEFTRSMRVRALSTLTVGSGANGINLSLRKNGTTTTVGAVTASSGSNMIEVEDIFDVVSGDYIDVFAASDASTATSSSNSARSILLIQEIPFSNTAINATQNAQLTLSTSPGHGSTGVSVLRYSNILNNVGSGFFTYTSSATNGDSITILQPGNYEVYMQYESSDADREYGITVNAPNTTTNITSYASQYVIGSSAGIASRRNSFSRTVKLNAGDVIRAQDDQGTLGVGTDDNRFGIKFLGYTN